MTDSVDAKVSQVLKRDQHLCHRPEGRHLCNSQLTGSCSSWERLQCAEGLVACRCALTCGPMGFNLQVHVAVLRGSPMSGEDVSACPDPKMYDLRQSLIGLLGEELLFVLSRGRAQATKRKPFDVLSIVGGSSEVVRSMPTCLQHC